MTSRWCIVEDTAKVVAFDPKQLKIVRRMPIGVAKVPTGLGYDPKTNHLFIGCREKPLMVVMDAATGKLVTTFPIGPGVDWADFDAKHEVAMTSSGGDGSMGMFRQKGGKYVDLGAFKTEPGAKTFAFDAKTGRIFLPTADIVSTPASGEKKGGRSIPAGTFRVLVAGR